MTREYDQLVDEVIELKAEKERLERRLSDLAPFVIHGGGCPADMRTMGNGWYSVGHCNCGLADALGWAEALQENAE